MANAFHYSIGRKFIQAVSGAFLIIFLLLHVTINLFSVIDSFTGNYNGLDGLFQKGCDFMALPIVTIMVPVLAAGFIIHIIYGCWLTWKNIKARGGYKRYEASSVAAADSWSAKNMFVLGIITTAFPLNLLPVVAVLNYLVYCGDWLFDFFRPSHVRQRQKTVNFKREARRIQREQANKPYHYKCAVCGRTDVDHPELEFRYCSRCVGYHCFCQDHINNHVHFTE